MNTIITTSEYWNCECIKQYIHHKNDTQCKKCEMSRYESPDSHVNEVIGELGVIPDPRQTSAFFPVQE